MNDNVFGDGFHLFGIGGKQYEADAEEYADADAIVAGYDALNPKQCFRTVQMPVHTDSHHKFLLFGKVMDYTAAKMNLNVNLGQDTLDCASGEQPQP